MKPRKPASFKSWSELDRFQRLVATQLAALINETPTACFFQMEKQLPVSAHPYNKPRK